MGDDSTFKVWFEAEIAHKDQENKDLKEKLEIAIKALENIATEFGAKRQSIATERERREARQALKVLKD